MKIQIFIYYSIKNNERGFKLPVAVYPKNDSALSDSYQSEISGSDFIVFLLTLPNKNNASKLLACLNAQADIAGYFTFS